MSESVRRRLGDLEAKIDFIMRAVRLQKMTPTGMFDAQNRPQMRVEQVTLLDIYRQQAQTPPTPPSGEPSGRRDSPIITE